MAIEVPQNKEISGGWRKGVGSAIRERGANKGAYTLRNDNKKELLREMLIPTGDKRLRRTARSKGR